MEGTHRPLVNTTQFGLWNLLVRAQPTSLMLLAELKVQAEHDARTKKLPIQGPTQQEMMDVILTVLMESYSRTRWLDKLRPAGTPHRWMGRRARWHLSWPLADTTAQKKKMTTFLDSCMSSLRLSMLFFSVSFKREIPRIMFVILTQRPCSPVLVLASSKRSSYADTVGEGVKTGKSSGQCTVEIPVQSTAREFHTSLPYRRTSPLVNNFLNPATHSSKLHKKTKKNDMSSQEPCCSLLKKKNTICALSVHAQASTQVSVMYRRVIASHFAPGPC